MPDQWYLNYNYKQLRLKFKLALTGFKHVGIFPEQAVNWNYLYDHLHERPEAKVLNLFAYTGGASLAAKAAGADVIHCDSIRQVVNWANTNMQLSKLDGIRWLIEDAYKFVQKEARRGRVYQGILLDPPAWGHGPKGEKWKLEEQINELIRHIAMILDKDSGLLIFNSYSLGFSPLILRNLLHSHLEPHQLRSLELCELVLKDRSKKLLPAGITAKLAY